MTLAFALMTVAFACMTRAWWITRRAALRCAECLEEIVEELS